MGLHVDCKAELINSSTDLWSYILYLIPKLSYLAPSLLLLKDECIAIQAPTIMLVLPKLHLNRYTAQSIVFAPFNMEGYFCQNCMGHRAMENLHISMEPFI